MITFAYPDLFVLLALPYIVYNFLPPISGLSNVSLSVPFINDLKNIKKEVDSSYFPNFNEKILFSLKLFYLFILWTLLVTAVARPQFLGTPQKVKTENRDIMLVIDISTSMLQKDYSTNKRTFDRLTAVKFVVSEFIKNRTEDRFGLVLFGTRAYLQSPLTFDRAAISEILFNTEAGMAGNSTSIGDALGLALKNIRKDENKDNKIIILLSDGESNDGSLSMAQAIDLAEKEGIKVYTIGVGSEGGFMGSLLGLRANELDEKSLKELAQRTKGNYFKATNLANLQLIYNKIDEMEPKSNEGSIVQEKHELFYIPLIIALILSIGLVFYLRRGGNV